MSSTKHAKGNPIGWAQSVLKPGMTVIDGGANVGFFTEAAARCVGPTGRVYAVEPDRRCLPKLNAKAQAFPQVFVVHAALTARGNDVTLFVGDQSERSSLKREAVNDIIDTQMVPGIALDHITHQRVDLVKLDLQGWEPEALKGASTLITQCPRWVVEFWPAQHGKMAEWMLWVFANFDFRAYWMNDGYPEAKYDDILAYALKEHEPHEHLNVVFSRL